MSARYTGGIITKNPQPLNPAAGNAANGVFTMDQYMQAVQNGTWPAYDPYFENTTLLLHGNGTNGAQNNTFLDSSTNNFTITRNGNTTQGSFSPFGQNWSAYFPSEAVTYFSPQTYFEFATGNNTIECWFYPTVSGVGYNILIANPYGVTNARKWGILVTNTGNLQLYLANGSSTTTSTNAVTVNQWNHLVIVTDISLGNTNATVTFYINGVGNIQTGKNLSGFTNSGENICFSDRGGDSFSPTYNNYMSNFRWVRNASVYSGSTITVPTAPLGAITDTKILTLQSNRFVDNSGNNLTIYKDNTSQISKFSPFPITTAYDPAVNGGSGYFDGSGDYLTMTDNNSFNIGANEFSIELWYYTLATATERRFIGQWGSAGSKGIILTTENQTPRFYYTLDGSSDLSIQSSVTPPINQWNHLVVCRSGSTLSMFLNGSRVVTATQAGTFFNASSNIGIGADASGVVPMNGYISNLRSVIGSSVYDATQTTITIPTTPPTAITNTQLLCNFTNAGIFDNTGFNNLETVGNAQIDTSVKKYGTGAMKFDGTGDWLFSEHTADQLYDFRGGDWTIECWVYPTTTTSRVGIVSIDNNTNWGTIYLRVTGNGSAELTATASTSGYDVQIIAGTVPINTWTHLAGTRSGNSFRLFINGTQVGSTVTNSTTLKTGNDLIVGALRSTVIDDEFIGYIDDLRITKGIARYTSNFTPQTSQWQDQ